MARKTWIMACLLGLLSLCSCKTHYVITEKEVPVETVKVEYRTSTRVDSVYVMDSVSVYMEGDTVFKDKIRLVYRDLLRTDTVHERDSVEKPVYVKTEEVTEVNRLTVGQKFLAWSGFVAWILLVLFLVGKLKDKLGVDT